MPDDTAASAYLDAHSTRVSQLRDLFDRPLTAHLAQESFDRLQSSRVLVAGLGGGSNIAELLTRKGFGRITLADPDVYEPSNVRQRFSTADTWGRNKAEVAAERIQSINPHVECTVISEGITSENLIDTVQSVDVVIEMIDFSAFPAKLSVHRAAHAMGRYAITAPSLANGAALLVFGPRASLTYDQWIGYYEGVSPLQIGRNLVDRLVVHCPDEVSPKMLDAAASGVSTFPLDAGGVDQAAVLAACAAENIVLERWERVPLMPQFQLVDVSDCRFLGQTYVAEHS